MVDALMPSARTSGRPQAAIEMSPESVAPVPVHVTHESCPITGRTVAGQSGATRELRFFPAQGIDDGANLTAGSLVSSLGDLTYEVKEAFAEHPVAA